MTVLNQLLIYINLLGIFLLSVFIDQDISVKLNTPSEVQAGQEFEVSLVILKGDLESFSRFTQELPYGLTAKRVSTSNADFSFENQRLRLIWLKLPANDSIIVNYRISVDKRLKGIFDLEGEFAFIDENQRQSVEVSGGGSILILPDPDVPDSLLVDIGESEKLFAPGSAAEAESGKLMVSRSEPEKTGNYQYTVSLNIKKGDLQKFAKIEEYIPEGFRAVEGESQDGIFTFSQGVVKILWMNLPEENEFEVDYHIIPEPGYSIENLVLNGSFSYITGNKTESIPVSRTENFLAENPEETTEQESSETESPEISVDTIPETLTETNLPKDVIIAADTGKEELSQAQSYQQEKSISTETHKMKNSSEENFMLQEEEGIYYRVQLAAGHHKVNIDNYFSRRNVKDDVKMEFHEGWRKYTTGSFKVYKDARDYRVSIWETTPIKDAFVSAYNNGRRITVQEALMVTNHRWYR